MSQVFCTFALNGLIYGIAVERVREIVRHRPLAPVPMAPPEIPGLLNLRGQLLTALDLRTRLGLPDRDDGQTTSVVVSWNGEFVAFQVDKIGDVVELDDPGERLPDTLSRDLRGAIARIHRVQGSIVHCLDVDAIMARADA